MIKVTKNKDYDIHDFTDCASCSRSAVYVSGAGSAELMFIDPDGNENSIQVLSPGDNDVINHGIRPLLIFRITGVSAAAPMYIQLAGIE